MILSESTLERIIIGAAVLLLLAVLGVAGNLGFHSYRYRSAVIQQAREHGLEWSDLTFHRAWPMDLYATEFVNTGSPLAVEALIGDAASPNYYLIPQGGSGDSTLVQTFVFQVGPRVNVIQCRFVQPSAFGCFASNQAPGPGDGVDRDQGLAWFDANFVPDTSGNAPQ